MNILIISPEPWTALPVSKHHYARTLASRGHRVAFLDPPDATRRIVDIEPGEVGRKPWIIRGPRIAPGLRLLPAWLRRMMEARHLNSMEELLGWRFDIVWLFENSRFYDMSFAGERVRIYHQVDLDQDFHVAEALKTADIRLCTTRAILSKFNGQGFDGHIVAHGVSVEAPDLIVARNSRIRPGRVAAAFVGNLDREYLNHSLLADLIVRFPDVDFHLIGSNSEASKLRSLAGKAENAVWWGRIESALVVPTLKNMDVLLLVYDTQRHREQMASPHKVMEYMASGVVTVATFTEELNKNRNLLVMVDPGDNFVLAFADVIKSLDVWNSPERRQQRISFAMDNTYDRQIERISDILHADRRASACLGEERL